jgi:hypothetical protein
MDPSFLRWFYHKIGLLLCSIHMTGAILSQGIELHGILKHAVAPLFEVQELLQLTVEQTYR